MRPRKRFGQHFLESNWARKVAGVVGARGSDVILEIGPGRGAITHLLSPAAMHVVAFDGTTDPFADCAAYREFHRELAQRLATPPVVTRATLIGTYHGRRPWAALDSPGETLR